MLQSLSCSERISTGMKEKEHQQNEAVLGLGLLQKS
jgi:hypothetical protein